MYAVASTNGFNTFSTATATNDMYAPSLSTASTGLFAPTLSTATTGIYEPTLSTATTGLYSPTLLNGMPVSDMNGTAIAVVGLLNLATCTDSMDTVIHNINNSKTLNIVDDKTGTTCVDTINNTGNITWLL